MRIRTILAVAIFTSLLLISGLGVMLFQSHSRVEEVALVEEHSHAITQKVTRELVLILEYSLYEEKRAITQWKATHIKISELLEQVRNLYYKIPKTIESHHLLMDRLFQQLIDIRKKEQEFLKKRQKQLLLDQLLSHSQAMIDISNRWNQSISAHHQNLEDKFHVYAIATPFIMLMLLLFLASLIIWRILNPIQKFQDAVDAVANGDLSIRATTEKKDELGKLSAAFDSMAIDMVNQLRLEVEERKRSEQLLKGLYDEIKILKEKEKENIYLATVQSTQHILNNLLNQLALVKREIIKNPTFSKNISHKFDDMVNQAQDLVVKLSSVEEIEEEKIKNSVYPK